ncbi:MAG: serine hydrolase [Mariprofundus sp.]|nr:serine hydrolase [Mariprofundus sp.]
MTSKFLLGFFCSLMITMPAYSFASNTATPSIRQHSSPDLQQRLDASIKHLHLDKAVRQKRLSIALVDITDPSAPSMAQVNGNEMMYAASLPKIAILLAAFERIAHGKLTLNNDTRETMTKMIRHSSNKDATAMIRKVGKEYINQVLASPKYRLYDPNYNGGLWVGKEYASSAAFHRDPLHHLSHGATAMQVARFYYMLQTGNLVSPTYSHEMKTILSKPGINHKFVKGLSDTNAEIYRKSGSWRSFHADSALIEHNGRRYIAVALAHDSKGGVWMTQLIREMDNIIFQHADYVAQVSATKVAKAPRSSAKRIM